MSQHRFSSKSLSLLIVVLAFASTSAAQSEKLIERGRLTYEINCSNCHGPTGQGDGEIARLLRVQPTDLSRIRLTHDGEFPRDELYRIIDGRQPVKGHGSPEMPIWGWSFMERGSDQNQEDMIRGRILQVLLFLDSIQVDADGEPWKTEEEEKGRKDSSRRKK